ncbi:MAG: hypothetical protein IKK50_04250 [Ruminiclostridium sp.]|nr:hypothetical protein [Ruminiclostridium sp.]
MYRRPEFLKALFDGNIDPQARQWEGSPLKPLSQKLADTEKALLDALSPEQKALFEQYQQAEWNLDMENEYETFRVGFRLGAHCIYEVFGLDMNLYYR